MKKGDIIICVDVNSYNLTLGKKYKVNGNGMIGENYVTLNDNIGTFIISPRKNFKLLSDIRDEQIDNILNG
jgi:hypothetical protein